ncbi:MAG: beta-lactamase family protein [Clostridia bacterium]|nr:beta-lactamase family protein [Clostridia bacterium]
MNRFDRVAAYMEKTVCGEHRVPGCDILIYRDHDLLYRHICGYSDREAQIPLTENHLYYMYSCTKVLTASSGMRLWEEGKLDLDAPVSDYLPVFANVKQKIGDDLCEPECPLLVRHLFTMSGGFDYGMRTPEVAALLEANPGASTREIVDLFAKKPLLFTPGARFQYSICHDILAAVIEQAAGMRFSDYLKAVIFDPIGMRDSTFRETEEIHARLAGQYTSDSSGNVTRAAQSNSHRLSDNYDSGGAGLICSAADYAMFADTMACGGTAANGYRFLKPETVKYLHTDQLPSYTMDGTFSCAAGPGYGYGFGVRTRLDQNEGQRSPIGEFGWDGAAGSYVMCDDTNHLSIFFAMHVLAWPNCIGSDHAVIRDMVYDALNL